MFSSGIQNITCNANNNTTTLLKEFIDKLFNDFINFVLNTIFFKPGDHLNNITPYMWGFPSHQKENRFPHPKDQHILKLDQNGWYFEDNISECIFSKDIFVFWLKLHLSLGLV